MIGICAAGLGLLAAAGRVEAHGDNLLAFSTEEGGGTLVTSGYHLDHQKVDTTCALELDGACVFFTADVPGFDAPQSDVPEGRFALEGTTLSVEVVAIDPAVALKVGDTTLTAPGQSAVIGQTPDAHAHVEWQLTPEGAAGDFPVEFRLTATGYAPSEVLVATVTNLAASEDGCGDPSGDGRISDADAVEVLRAAVELSSTCDHHTCDVNQDEAIDDVDAVLVLQRAAALPAELTCEPPHD
jgi:hypothetical protein